MAGYVIRFGLAPGVHTDTRDVGLVTRFRIEGLAHRTLYYFVVEAYGSAGDRSSASNEVSAVALSDGDPRWDGLRFTRAGAADLVVWRPGDGTWHTDLAVWRPGNGMWYIRTSSSYYQQSFAVQWGAGYLNDVPVPGDCDGDGRMDLAVWRPSTGTWHVRRSSTFYTTAHAVQWGAGVLHDVPLTGAPHPSR